MQKVAACPAVPKGGRSLSVNPDHGSSPSQFRGVRGVAGARPRLFTLSMNESVRASLKTAGCGVPNPIVPAIIVLKRQCAVQQASVERVYLRSCAVRVL